MYREIVIDDQNVALLANAATPYRFKQIFGSDLMKVLNGINKGQEDEVASLDVIVQLAFVMNAQAEKKDISTLSFEAFLTWAEQFGPMSIVEKAEDIVAVYMGNAASSSQSKKKGGKPNVK